MLNLYSTFLGTQSALYSKVVSPHPPAVCSIHLDDVTAAIVRQNAPPPPPPTPAYWWRGDRVMKPISVWGWLGGHDSQRQWREFGQDAGVTSLLFMRSAMGFLMTTESQDLGLTSHPKDGAFYSIVSPSLYSGARTHTDRRVSTPCWPHLHLFQQQPSFPGGLPFRYWPAQSRPYFASVGNQSWATVWYGCWLDHFWVKIIKN